VVGVDGEVLAGGDSPADVLTDVLRVRARVAAVAEAALLEAVVAVADRDPLGFDADLVAFALRWTQTAARAQVEFGRYLQRVIKPVWAAMCAGDLDVPRARVFHDVLAVVDDDIAFGIALDFVDRAALWTTGQLRERLRRAVCKADPAGVVKRTAASIAERRVCLAAERDGTVGLFATSLPAPRAVAAFERVDAFARARRAAGDVRTLDQLRADTVLDLLEGVETTHTPVFRRGVVEISVPWATLAAGLDQPDRCDGRTPPAGVAQTYGLGAGRASDAGGHTTRAAAQPNPGGGSSRVEPASTSGCAEPARLAGFGPLDAQTARGVVGAMFGRRDVRWRFRVTGESGELWQLGSLSRPRDLRDLAGQLRDISTRVVAEPQPPDEADPRRRKPGPALSRWIRARDGTCRAPGCRAPAAVCDLDHTTSHASDGLTTHDNLALLCRHHHRLKHESGWHVTQPTPGVLTWQSPHGESFTSA
jgi:hypothetical protein